jgi:N6-L-threonylcarbamoyladenine synthase
LVSSSPPRLVLGIETTCDETAAAVVLRSDGRSKVLSSVIATQHELHAEYAGVVPEIASRAHVERMVPTLRQAVRDAGVSLGELDLIGVADRPGLIGSLLVGVSAAKGLAWSLGVPVCGVHHVHAHLFAPLLESETDLDQLLPAIGLAVSGGHTAIYAVHGPEHVRTVGATIDDALGEAFDKAATILGLGHPGGPLLEQLASTGDPRAHEFPISRLGRESTDFSFSGLKTAVLYAVRGLPQRGGVFERDHTALSHQQKADIAASFQRAAAAALSLKLERALQLWEGERPVSLLAGGGVIANSAVRHAIQKVCAQTGLVPMLSPTKYCTDNAAMIAGLAALLPVPEQSMAMASAPRSTVTRGTER